MKRLEADTAYSLYDSNIPSFIRVGDSTGRKLGPSSDHPTVAFWNLERVRMLLLLKKKGITHKKIALTLGTTENAVRAKAAALRKSI